MNKLQLHIAVLIVLASAKFSYPQPIFTSSSLGLSLKYGNIDRSRLDRQSTVVADFNNDMLEDAVKLDRSMNSLNYYVNEGNGYVGLIKSIGVGNAESVSLISSGISQNSVAVIYKDKSVRVVTQTELNSTAMEIPTFNPPFKSATDEFNFNEVWTSTSGYMHLYNCIATDIDNDGRNEIIFSGRPDSLGDCNYTYIYVYESDGDNHYRLDWDTTYLTEPVYGSCLGRIDLTDIDNNGHKEICFNDGGVVNGESYVKFMECLGPGQYRFYSSNIPNYWPQRSDGFTFKMVECDVNHDGRKELVVLNSALNVQYDYVYIQVCTFAYKTATQFIFNPIKLVKYQSPSGDLDVGDINGDGKDEIIMGGASWYDDHLYYFDSTGSNILWWGNGGAGYEFKTIYTGMNMGAGYVLARDLNGDGKKEWLVSAIGQGFGGFAVVRHLHDSTFNVEMYDTSLYSLGYTGYFDNNSAKYFIYANPHFYPGNIYHGELQVYDKVSEFLFAKRYYRDFYPIIQGWNYLNVLDIDNDSKVNIIFRKFIREPQYNSYYIADLENEYVIGIGNINSNATEFRLYQNYPNPFNPKSNIKYQISKLNNVTLKVYDVLGRKILTLVNKRQPQGTYSVEFDGTNLPSGIYFYRLEAINDAGMKFVNSKKMVLIK